VTALSALCATAVVGAYFFYRSTGWDGWVVVMGVSAVFGIVSAAIAIARGAALAGGALLLVNLGLLVGFGAWVVRIITSVE
jgi:hypothetical protein